jgi:hypothetical protein
MRRRRPSDAADVTMSANSRLFSLLPRGSDLAGALLLLPRGSDFARELCVAGCAWPVVRGLDSVTCHLTLDT